MSTGDVWTEINLRKNATTLMIGENGAGKSTILDALCFVLFGKPFRKINKPQLINSINQKGLLVEVEFSIGKIKYRIIRGLKPNIFDIHVNGKLVEQAAAAKDYQEYLEKNILKLNFSSFTQIVVLGSSTFIPFMQLSAQQRREIIEDLLDLKIFTSMNILLKEKLQTNRETLSDMNYKIEVDGEKLKVHTQYVEEIKISNQKRIETIQTELDLTQANINKLTVTVSEYEEDISILQEHIKDDAAVQKKIRDIQLIKSKLTDKIETLKKEVFFYENNNNCPTCNQVITNETKHTSIECKYNKIGEIEDGYSKLAEQLNKWSHRLNDIETTKKSIQQTQQAMHLEVVQVSSLNSYSIKLQKNMIAETGNIGDLDAETAKISKLRSVISKYEEHKEELLKEKHIFDTAADLLKDKGIKTQIIKQYIPVMNKLINKYLASMEFFVHFELTETFDGVIKSRHRDEFSYPSFSEGEKMRIDLALLMTWRAIAKMKNSTNTNLLLLDEVFDASLDANGSDEFLKLLNELGKNNNVFVISHKGDLLQDKFRAIIKFEKHKNFSRIAA